jgi:membrane-associated protease RseP (regulator of RpoE activity)
MPEERPADAPVGPTSEAPTLQEARSFSGRRLAELIAAVVAVVALAERAHALGTLAVVAAVVAAIILHELGHYVVARASGMEVTEFFVGFGPKVFSWHRNGTEYGLKALLVGGYVRITGMTSADEVPPEREARTYRSASFPRRVAVSAAGSAVHFLLALGMLWYLFSGIGAYGTRGVVVASVTSVPGVVTPAQRAGLAAGDRILAVDGEANPTIASFGAIVARSAGQPLRLRLEEPSGAVVVRTVQPIPAGRLASAVPAYRALGRKGVLGVVVTPPVVRAGILGGAADAGRAFGSLAAATVSGLISHFTPHGISTYLSEVAHPSSRITSAKSASRFESPVGIVQLASDAVQAGLGAVLELLVLINVFVGIFNLVPLLPLDGGHVAIAIYERIRSRPGRPYHADVLKLMPVTYAVIAVILFLSVTALYLDITHPVPNPFS